LVERLDDLLKKGVTEVVSFVPWQAVEADISHALTRFLQAAAERKITVQLVVSPEVGISYPNSGIPRDVLAKSECLALNAEGKPCVQVSSPNSHTLPSLLAPEFQKRYQSYLQRVDHFLLDVMRRSEPGVLDRVQLVLTGSYWKYYRVPSQCLVTAFDGMAGDYSAAAGMIFRNRVEQRFSDPEFCEPSPASANRWKQKSMEEVNRRWFYQQSEDQFRTKAGHFFNRKALSVAVEQMELFSPESDPAFLYSRVLSHVSNAKADFTKLAGLVDEAATHRAQASGSSVAPWVNWGATGSFASLSMSEKQFLILKGILLLASQSGGVLVDSEEWFSLSDSFRRKAESLARSLGNGEYRLRQRVFYWNSHLWSSGGGLWDELEGRLGSLCRMIASEEALRGEEGMDADLLVVDPSLILTRSEMVHLLTWTRGGRVTAIPRSVLYTERARAELSRVTNGAQRLDLHVGVPFELYTMGEGKLVIYDSQVLDKAESLEVHRQFIQALMGLGAIKNPCVMSDSRLQVIGLERRGGGRGIFVLNPQQRALESDLIFPNDVCVEDLGQQLQNSDAGSSAELSGVSAQKFHLEVPPCGVLPMQVLDVQWEDELERRQAARLAEQADRMAESMAAGALAGWNAPNAGELPWN